MDTEQVYQLTRGLFQAGLKECTDVAIQRRFTMLAAKAEALENQLNRLQEAVGAVQPYIPRNRIRMSVNVALLQYRDGIAHIDRSLENGHISLDQAHRQKSKLAGIYAGHITDQVCEGAQRLVHSPEDTQHRYLVLFRKVDCQYFRTDCSFGDGQLDLAVAYVWAVVDALEHLEEGRVLNAATHAREYGYP